MMLQHGTTSYAGATLDQAIIRYMLRDSEDGPQATPTSSMEQNALDFVGRNSSTSVPESRPKHPPIGMLWKLGEEMPAQVASTSLDHGSK
ncbi:hypothetical protein TNCV_4110651 [Trichonephila clavipes]|nr:hypothetical protein TNCV_4110651 [Trichonephila clavipes]